MISIHWTARALGWGSLAIGVGCASVPEPRRERGLTELRELLDLTAPVGVVVAGRLVHTASRVSLVQTPSGTWGASPIEGQTLLFEGTPGAALVLGHLDARIGRMDDGFVTWAPVFERELPATTKLGAVTHTFASEPLDVFETTLDLPGGPVGVRITPFELSVVAKGGADVQTFGEPVPSPVCGGVYEATLSRGTTSDGATWLHFSSNGAHRTSHGACTDEMRDTPPDEWVEDAEQHERELELWVVVPRDGGPVRVVESSDNKRVDFFSEITGTRVFDVPGGTLTCALEGSGGPRNDFMGWTWTLETSDGSYVLADGYN